MTCAGWMARGTPPPSGGPCVASYSSPDTHVPSLPLFPSCSLGLLSANAVLAAANMSAQLCLAVTMCVHAHVGGWRGGEGHE